MLRVRFVDQVPQLMTGAMRFAEDAGEEIPRLPADQVGQHVGLDPAAFEQAVEEHLE